MGKSIHLLPSTVSSTRALWNQEPQLKTTESDDNTRTQSSPLLVEGRSQGQRLAVSWPGGREGRGACQTAWSWPAETHRYNPSHRSHRKSRTRAPVQAVHGHAGLGRAATPARALQDTPRPASHARPALAPAGRAGAAPPGVSTHRLRLPHPPWPSSEKFNSYSLH